jgi:uncharacterized membrane protein YphA (DoxX/SURF4 family)
LVRVLTGAMWLIHGVPKFVHSDRFMPPNGFFASYLQQGIAGGSGPYRDFLLNVVQPNAGIFAELVRLGEVCVGISLVLGLFSRLGGFVGIVLPLNYVAARNGLGSFSEWATADGALMLLSAISFVLPTGRVAGCDALLTRRTPRRATVVPEVVPERPLQGPTAPS